MVVSGLGFLMTEATTVQGLSAYFEFYNGKALAPGGRVQDAGRALSQWSLKVSEESGGTD